MKHIYLISITLLGLWGCGTENAPTFTLTTSVSPSGAGTITPTHTLFDKGESVTLQANPASGWTFLRWEGDINKPTNPLGLIMDRDYNLVGVFEQSGLTDIDGNVYSIVQIGTQTWMASNLKTTRYRDGSFIPNVSNSTAWSGLSSGAWVNYDNNSSNDAIYGKLYNWYAVSDSRNLCPLGWHVPSDAEWTVLSNFLGTDAGFKMRSTTGWNSNGNGSNESGFNGLPGGDRYVDGTFYYVGRYGSFWSSTQNDTDNAWYRGLDGDVRGLKRNNYSKSHGFSVRCIRD